MNFQTTSKIVGSQNGPTGVIKSVRMVDSDTQTSDDLLEDLLLEKLKSAYEARQKELARENEIHLDF